jgi:hypothetical protein
MGGLPGDLGIAGSLLGFRCGIAGAFSAASRAMPASREALRSAVRASRATLTA